MRNTIAGRPYFFLLLAAIAAEFLYGYYIQGPGIDREVFRYAGMSMANGEAPYVSFFDHKPPLIYFVYLLAHPFGVYGPQVIFTILTFIVSLQVYACCKRYTGRYALLMAVLWIAMLHDPLIAADGGQSRQFSALAITSLFCYGLMKKERVNWLLVGLGTFLVFFTQQTDILGLIPFLIWLSVQPGQKAFIKKALLFIAGFIASAIFLLLWLYSKGALNDFFYDAFAFNGKWYVDAYFFGSKSIYIGVMLLKTLFIVPLAALLLPVRSPHRPLVLTVLLCGCVQAVALVPGFFFNHYFLSLVPYAFFAWVLLVNHLMSGRMHPKLKTAWLPVAFLLVLFYIKPIHWINKNTNTAERQMIQRLQPYAQQVKGQRGQLFGLDMVSCLSLNASYDIISPSKWLYVHFWLRPGWDPDLGQFKKEVLQPLDSFNCRYVLDRDTDIYNWRPDMKKIWEDYLRQHYTPVLEARNPKGRILYRLHERNHQ